MTRHSERGLLLSIRTNGSIEPMVAIRGHFDGKVIVPDEPVNLPENEPLIVHVERIMGEAAGATQSFFDWAAQNPIDDPSVPNDLAEQHDHYLYGTLKKKD